MSGAKSEQTQSRHAFHKGPDTVAGAVIDGEGAGLARNAATDMIDYSVGFLNADTACKAHSKSDIDIFMVAEKSLIKSAKAVKGFAMI